MRSNIYLIFICLFCIGAFGQAKKPELMVVPSDVWCKANNAMEVYNNQGVIEHIPSYSDAVLNSDLMNVISKINILMADRGFPLKDLSQEIKNVKQKSIEDAATRTKDGAELAESPIDFLKRRAKSDIILSVDWKVSSVGPKKSITYNLVGLDAYTSKQIAGAQGTGSPSFSASIPLLLEAAVLDNMDNFTNQLQAHFDDLFVNGREIRLDILVFENDDDVDLETEYNGDELMEIIDDWMAQNTVGGRYNKTDSTETMANYEGVRISVYDAKGVANDAGRFGNNLRKFLKGAPYNLICKVQNFGQGRVKVIIGGK